jgi:xanthine dehydrogenase molybdopterin-binding subunit B
MNKILMHCLYQGASFGGWSQVPWNMGGHYCAAVVAKRTGRPVKWIFNRREDFYGGQMDEVVQSPFGFYLELVFLTINREFYLPFWNRKGFCLMLIHNVRF